MTYKLYKQYDVQYTTASATKNQFFDGDNFSLFIGDKKKN